MSAAEVEQLTASQAARRLGVSAERIRQLMSAGQLDHVRTPLGRLVSADAVERLAVERQAKQAGR